MRTLVILTAIFVTLGFLFRLRASIFDKQVVSDGNPLPGTVGVLGAWLISFVMFFVAIICGIATLITYLVG